jgi:signal transduction histidine kinase
MVNEVLDVQKLKSNSVGFDLKPFDLRDLVKQSSKANEGFASEYRVALRFENPVSEAMVEADGERLIQVLTNLISNAVKYSPAGEDVVISMTEMDRSWRVSVKDCGPGIPNEARRKVFEAFGQIKSLDGVKRSGTGLGLTISKAIVEGHKGHINFHSEAGSGTEFYFDLPKLEQNVLPKVA